METEEIISKLTAQFHLNGLEVCNTFWKRLHGLMFSKPKNIVIVLDKESVFGASIHMLFVFYTIDVYWLDEKFAIVDKRTHLKPFCFASSKRKSKYIVEIPAIN